MTKRTSVERWGVVVAGTLLALTAACDESSTDLVPERLLQVTHQDGLIFMTQNVHPNDHMEALIIGTLAVDGAGCLRADTDAGHTMVWPAGYTLDTSGATARVIDDAGAVVVAVGESFTLAGGEVPSLLASMGFTDEDRERATACPGKYWIVNGES